MPANHARMQSMTDTHLGPQIQTDDTSYSLYQYDDEATLLGEFESIDALHAELESTAATLQQKEESDGWLCASKYADKILPDTDALVLSPAILQNLAAADQAMEYDYCPGDFRESRRRNLMSFFLLTFPQGHEPLPDNFSGDWFFPGKHRGQRFILTPDQDTLEDYICHLSETGFSTPLLRIDYFSTGSTIWWLTGRETIRAMAQMGATLELRIHPAMLVAEEDSIRPMVSSVLRSKVWRTRLIPPDAQA